MRTAKLTRKEWDHIHDVVEAASKAVTEASHVLTIAFVEHADADYLRTLAERLATAEDALNGLAYLTLPQSEWQGGETWKTREPHIVGNFPAYLDRP